MGIVLLRRHEIDDVLWDKAVDQSQKHLPYAYTWYLDQVSRKQWSALVENDYERVMPLVWNRKLFGIKQIYQPILTQQLGVFGQEVEQGHYDTFFRYIPNTFWRMNMGLNKLLDPKSKLKNNITTKINLVLHLNQPYENIQSGYSKSLKKRIKKAAQHQVVIESKNIDQLISIYKTNLSQKVRLEDKHYQTIAGVIKEAVNRERGKIYEVRDLEDGNRVCCMGFFLETTTRIINVFGASTSHGKDKYSMHLMLDQVIKTHAGEKEIFDFEGSEIPGVATFFRSFGSIEENFSFFQKDKLLGWIKWLNELKGRLLV